MLWRAETRRYSRRSDESTGANFGDCSAGRVRGDGTARAVRGRRTRSNGRNSAKGTIGFEQRGDKVFVDAKISGLAPGAHGFHVHEKGDCSSSDGMSAGGHFNPTAKPHGNPASAEHHVGDMPALVADASGNASFQGELAPMSVGAGVTDIVGKAVIVHKDADDYATQPTGNSGARVACGVIRKR